MAKKPLKSKDLISPEQAIAMLENMQSVGETLVKFSTKTLANIKGKQSEPEIRIIEQGAIPAAYYYRDSVVEAIRAEILKDHKAGQPIPPGVELIKNEEEDINGEAKEISGSENDSTIGGDGPESPGDGENNGSPAGGGGEDHNRQPNKKHHKDGSGKGSKTRGE